ncbi:hypothetical protein [Sphingomonas spermidinifaciens]|nr:hypothetical protein [Sphingomonas spermidinifaciens]
MRDDFLRREWVDHRDRLSEDLHKLALQIGSSLSATARLRPRRRDTVRG